MVSRLAVLLDGEYVKKVLKGILRGHPTADDVMAEVKRIRAQPDLSALDLYRVFYYPSSAGGHGRSNVWQMRCHVTPPRTPFRSCSRSASER